MAANSFGFGKKAALWAVAVLVVIVFAAWIDGGEEALHTINKPVEVSAFEAEGGGQ